MEQREYEFIHEEKPDGTKRDWKKVQRFVLLLLSGCIVLEITAAVALIYFSYRIQNNMELSSIKEAEITENIYNIENDRLEGLIKQSIGDNMASISDYKEIYGSLKSAAQDAGRYIVTINRINITKELPENQDRKATGIIVSKSSEIIIIADVSSMDTEDELQVTFYNGNSCRGDMIAKDDILGIAAVRVFRADVESSIYDNIETAKFIDDSKIETGENIIVMGNSFGKGSFVSYGNITSSSDNVNIIDGACHLLETDISPNGGVNGFVIDLDGRVIGIVNNSLKKKWMQEIVTAIKITDLENTINRMIEGKKKAFLGIDGEDVTDEVIRIVDKNMPYGVYVKHTVPDSPSYDAGILSGDIIVRMNGREIKDMFDIMSILDGSENGGIITVDVMRKGRDEYKIMKYEIIV